MKTPSKLIGFIILLLVQTSMKAQHWETPIIDGYGKIVHYENAQNQPDPTKDYKIIFHIKDGKEREGVNDGLWKVARLINLMGSYKVPQDHLKVVVVISGSATPLVLTNLEHESRAERKNPNLDLLAKLKQHDVKILVCGQALAKHDIDVASDLNEFIEVTVSALTAIPAYQMEGYVTMF